MSPRKGRLLPTVSAAAARLRSRPRAGAPELSPELQALRTECYEELRRRAGLAALASAVPVPGVDVAVDFGLMVRWLPEISARFRVSETELKTLDPRLAAIVFRALRSFGPTLLGNVVTKTTVVALARVVGVRLSSKQAARYLPVIGSAAAAALGYSAFMALGQRHIEQCVRLRLAIDGGDGDVHDMPAHHGRA